MRSNHRCAFGPEGAVRPGKIPPEAEYLGSEYLEDEAKSRVKAEAEAKQRQAASSRVQVLETVTSNITVGEGELIHAPVWFVYYTLRVRDT